MTQEELIKKIDAEITKLSDNACLMAMEDGGYRVACMDISDMLHEIAKEIQPSLPSNIDEAAEESMPEEEGFLEIDIYGGSEAVYSREQMLAMFKAGAEWMAGQGETKIGVATQDHFIRFADDTYIDIDPTMKLMPAFRLKDAEEIVVQIRKKQ